MKFPVFGGGLIAITGLSIASSLISNHCCPKRCRTHTTTADTLKPLFLLVWCGVGVPLSIIVEFLVWILVSLLILFFGRRAV